MLPLPPGYPAAQGSVQAVTFANNTIYGTFYDITAETMYLVSWNARGQLNSGYGRSGLVTIPSPFSNTVFLPGEMQSLLTGGKLIVAALTSPGAVALTPVDQSTGSVGSDAIEPLPSGVPAVHLSAIQLGPD